MILNLLVKLGSHIRYHGVFPSCPTSLWSCQLSGIWGSVHVRLPLWLHCLGEKQKSEQKRWDKEWPNFELHHCREEEQRKCSWEGKMRHTHPSPIVLAASCLSPRWTVRQPWEEKGRLESCLTGKGSGPGWVGSGQPEACAGEHFYLLNMCPAHFPSSSLADVLITVFVMHNQPPSRNVEAFLHYAPQLHFISEFQSVLYLHILGIHSTFIYRFFSPRKGGIWI